MPLRVSALVLFLLPSLAIGQSEASYRWLQAQPVSLLDWGIFKLERRLAELTIADTPKVHSAVIYERQTSSIHMLVTLVGTGTEGECLQGLRTIRAGLIPFGLSDAERIKAAPAVFAEVFTDSRGEAPASLGAELARSTFLRVHVNKRESMFALKPAVSCSGDFTSPRIIINSQ